MSAAMRLGYRQITRIAERNIRDLMAKAAKARQHKNLGRAQMYEDWAYGSLDLWRSLTSGKRTANDDQRLETLTKGENHESTVTDGDAAAGQSGRASDAEPAPVGRPAAS